MWLKVAYILELLKWGRIWCYLLFFEQVKLLKFTPEYNNSFCSSWRVPNKCFECRFIIFWGPLPIFGFACLIVKFVIQLNLAEFVKFDKYMSKTS